MVTIVKKHILVINIVDNEHSGLWTRFLLTISGAKVNISIKFWRKKIKTNYCFALGIFIFPFNILMTVHLHLYKKIKSKKNHVLYHKQVSWIISQRSIMYYTTKKYHVLITKTYHVSYHCHMYVVLAFCHVKCL